LPTQLGHAHRLHRSFGIPGARQRLTELLQAADVARAKRDGRDLVGEPRWDVGERAAF